MSARRAIPDAATSVASGLPESERTSGAGVSVQESALVLGGTGKSGRRVVERLRAVGRTVRVGSSKGNPPFRWTDPQTWAAVLDEMDAAFIVYSPDIAMPGAPEVIDAFTEQAVAAGVRRLVLLSGQKSEVGLESERRLQDSGADWTILRAAWFNQNFDEGFLREEVCSGRVALPVGDVGEGFIDADDIADVVATVLTRRGHSGAIYELTGPRLLTFAEAIAEIAEATDQEVKYVQISPESYAATLTAQGLSPVAVDRWIYLFTDLMDGRNARVEKGVQQVLGREPRDFTDYARAAAATGIWSSDR
ncbi:NAD(P)H-binding protein [Nocardia uniformis]|uniref:NAD(P)H-binding protein n=2 Tax=Nocardia uniformis TaxID=53432 RepID=A0A849BVX1_9NOCA|nr:NAD(P)H-binding protein [Nocardia uniformis]